MLSGIKFVPRDQLLPPESESDDGSGEERGKRNPRKKKKEKQQKWRSSSDDDDEGKKRKGKRKKRKKRKSRREYSSDDPEDSSGSEEEEKLRRKRKGKRRDGSSEDSDTYSDGAEYEKKEKKGDRGKEVSGDDKEVVRKEMGLEWMLSSGSKRDGGSSKIVSEPEEPKLEEVKRMNPRELNPYLRDNGSGYPDDASPSTTGGNQLLSSSIVGDGGASWRLKALKRAKEQAAREGRKLDEVVEERWGSLGLLAVSVAACKAAPAHAHLHALKDRQRGRMEKPEAVGYDDGKGLPEGVQNGNRDYLRDVSSRHPEMKKPKQSTLHWKRSRTQNISSEDGSLVSSAVSGINKFADDGSYLESLIRLQRKDAGVSNSSSCTSKNTDDHRENNAESSKTKDSSEVNLDSKQVLSANQLAAKILQLRMKGKNDEAEKLSKEMEALVEKEENGSPMFRQETGNYTRRYIEKQISSERKKKEEDADLHLAQKIMQNKRYSLAGREDDEYDYDDDAPSQKRNRRREGAPQEKKDIPRRFLTQQERCQFCFENPSRPKHLVVSIGNFTYMMLPQWQPVVQGHCCILPMQHESATRTVDKNVWEEIRNFKKCLLKMFSRQEKDVVFLETVIGLERQRRHCLIECIPIPCELAKQAPMYFKKAIDEAEDEWGQHEMKKVIPTSGNLRNVIPENLSYFHVEFGLDRGFAHVIDDDSNFRSSFGLNVIRGMLQLAEEDMHRRRRQEPVEKQKQAVASFVREWEPFDWTKDLD